MVKIDELKGKSVIAMNGMNIGKVEDIELNNNWAVTEVDVRLNDDIAKLYGAKGGFMTKSVVPLPSNIVGPISESNITLKEKITDVTSLREQIETSRSLR